MTGPVTDADLARWRKLADAATQGPWEAHRDPMTDPAHWTVDRISEDDDGDGEEVAAHIDGIDAEFIAAARDAVPSLLALVASQAEQIARVRALCDEIRQGRRGTEAGLGLVAGWFRAALDGAVDGPQ